MTKIKLIVGLGNIGNEYLGTRHNVGEWFLQHIAKQQHITLKHENKFHGYVAQLILHGQKVHLLYPSTYMNKSGLAVSRVAQFYKIHADEILVAHDELDIPCGQIRLKKGGGNGGHNGLKDIDAQLDARDYYRLRIGIDHPGHRDRVVGYVLGKPSLDDKITLDQAIERGYSNLEAIITGNFEQVMCLLHQK